VSPIASKEISAEKAFRVKEKNNRLCVRENTATVCTYFIAEKTWSKLVVFNTKSESNMNHKADIVSQTRKVQIHM